MPGNPPPEKPLTCPACFAREIDPVFLHFDPEDGGEFYCQHCGYTAKTRGQALAFHRDFIRHRHGIPAGDSPYLRPGQPASIPGSARPAAA